ncbi:helix-turn-helix transcriptional regulator [Psychromarinibacter sp. C21-152]|uniref:Helix-turn-helix transcriptional regulator n=1 Tax=Psychromarinibacter sediminicola TaxID=3033385 RepID=A0AAE3NSM6_9RHOB|nr:helix-turn-helix transcriptional regulator [Psychromarinibacter sediminicola]MDF0601701.1 helix-turn-helix transcriptional regulator [Psychromarinibacter sediminicola]
MLVVNQDTLNNGSHKISHEVADLVNDVGTKRFDESLKNIVWSHLHCSQITAFTFEQAQAPTTVGLFADNREEQVRQAATRYEEMHWQNDPSNFFLTESNKNEGSFAVIVSKEDIENTDFVEDCFLEPHVLQRLSFISNLNGDPFKLSFHKNDGRGKFDENAVLSFFNHIQTIMALIVKHVEITKDTHPEKSENEIFEDILRHHYPELTARERTVCGLIAIGLSSEAIALTLDISINTVLTFRKRAYSRLNISTQNELLRMLYRAQARW